jgi:adenylosuccinate synthase
MDSEVIGLAVEEEGKGKHVVLMNHDSETAVRFSAI